MKRRVLGVFLCLVLVLCSLVYITPDTSAKAAAASKLNKTKKTLYVCDTFTLKLNNASGKVSYSSSNKKVASVNSKGVVTALSAGKATIKVKNNGKTYKCKFTVKDENQYIVDAIYDEDHPLSVGCGEYKIKLSGKKEDHVVTDRLCYVEGKKCVLLLDRDVDLPGDFVNNVDLIMETLEKKVGFKFSESNLLSRWVLYKPWENIDPAKKIPIYIFTDRVDNAYISNASFHDCTIVMNELISQKVWDSVPSYRDEAWRRSDYVDYYTIAHELTHVLTLRYSHLTGIMTEGSAEFFALEVMKELADKDADFKKSYEHAVEQNAFLGGVQKKITKKNMESVFVDDYRDLSQMDREDKYILGRIICEYLNESYGSTFMKDYINALAKAGYKPEDFWGELSDDQIKENAKIMKKIFGKKVFENIAEYYNKNYK